jgi:hypothetical protein
MTIEIRDPRIQYRTATGWIDAFTGIETTDLGWPWEDTVGVDAIDGWEPAEIIDGEDGLDILEAGAVVEDIRITGGGTLQVRAPNVTLRRCEVINGSIQNMYGETCYNNLLIEDCTVRAVPQGTSLFFNKAIGDAGFTAKRCAIIDCTEGFRMGGTDFELANTDIANGYDVRIYDSFVRIAHPIGCTAETDFHGDAFQTFDNFGGGFRTYIRNCATDSINDEDAGCIVNAGIITGPDQATLVDIDRMLIHGGIYSIFNDDIAMNVLNLYFVEDSWLFGPIAFNDTTWENMGEWSAYVCTRDAAGQVATVTGTVPRDYPGFGPFDPPP